MTVITPIIPQKQKAAIYDKPGTVSTKVVELDVPEPGPGEVLINLYARSLPLPLPLPTRAMYTYAILAPGTNSV